MEPIKVRIPEVFAPLMKEKIRNKFFYGGRAGGKSYAFADSLLLLGRERKLFIACLREIQESIKDSVYKLLCDRLAAAFPIVKLLLAAGTPKMAPDSQMLQIKNYIQAHYPEKIRAEQLAEQLYVSVPTLFRRFRRAFGLSPANYINQVRLAQTALLLETTDRSLQEIGEAVGIADVFYLSKLFKQTYGVPPSVYRRRYRQS